MVTPPARWLVLTEDSSAHATVTLHALARHILARALGEAKAPPIEAEAPEGDLKQASLGCQWEHRGFAIALARKLSERLMMGEIIVFHHDGDTVWSKATRGERKGESFRATRFAEKVLRRVELNLGAQWPELRKNLRLVVPYYHIESWLYLNERELKRLIDEGRLHKNTLRELQALREQHGALDEVEQIAYKLQPGKRFNERLAMCHFPADQAEKQSPSFQATVAAWRTALRKGPAGPAA